MVIIQGKRWENLVSHNGADLKTKWTKFEKFNFSLLEPNTKYH